MATAIELLRQGRTQELWEKYCGFIDLSLEEFMNIQKRLLMEQIQWFGRCELGKKIMGEPLPRSAEEFRQRVPLTTYADYIPYLPEKREDVLPEKPALWMRTSGRSGEYQCKWAPIFREGWEATGGPYVMALLMFASCKDRGDFVFQEHDKIPFTMAPRPYVFGWIAHAMTKAFPFDLLPPQDEAEKMPFQERMKAAFSLGFREGIDIYFGLASVLVKMGEQFSGQAEQKTAFSKEMLHPKTIYRLSRGIIRSRLAGRPMYPKDLWDVKAIVTGGTDTSVFKSRIAEYWGKAPIEIYGGTEIHLIAMQTWDREGMTFLPDMSFLEFIPEDEHLKAKADPSYQPRTVLLNEVEAGKRYEIVTTSLRIGPFFRYRIGDMIKITALCNEKLGIDIPQMVFESRCDDIIDLAGFTRMTERTIWQALERSEVRYEDWTARKEIHDQHPILHLYLEPKGDIQCGEAVEDAIDQGLKEVDADYADIEEMLQYKPLRVTILTPGTFHRYLLDRQAAGAEPAHFKPPHVVHSQKVIDLLLQLSAMADQSSL